jgi:hypothetical protein
MANYTIYLTHGNNMSDVGLGDKTIDEFSKCITNSQAILITDKYGKKILINTAQVIMILEQ